MRYALKSELLRQLRRCVANLQGWKILNPEDIAVVRLMRVLHEKIKVLEEVDSYFHHKTA